MKLYESSLKNKRDAESVRLTAERKGRKEGERAKAIAIAHEMKKDGIPTAQIAKFTKLSTEEIERLK